MRKKILLTSTSLALASVFANANIKEGKVVEYYENSKNIKTESNYKNGKLEGKKSVYTPQGKLIEEIDYHDDKKNGFRYLYNENDTIKEIEFYYNDELLGNVEEEKIDTSKINGKYKSEFDDKLVFEVGGRDIEMIYETLLLNGVPHGEGKAYLNPKFVSDKTKQENSVYFYENGQLKSVEIDFGNNTKAKQEYIYESNGYTLKEKIFEKDALIQSSNLDLEGNEEVVGYYPAGQIKFKIKADGEKFYESLAYYPNGQIKERGFGVEDGKTGIWKTYKENGKIDSIAYYEGGSMGELVLLEKIKDFENGDFVVRKLNSKGVTQALFSLKNGLLEGELKFYNDGRLESVLPYQKHKIDGIAKFYPKSQDKEVMYLYSEGLGIGEIKDWFDVSHFSGTLSLTNQDGTTSVALYENGFAKELKILDKNQKILKEVKRNQKEEIEKNFDKNGELTTIRRGEFVQVMRNGKKQSEKYSLTIMGDINKKYKDGKLSEIDIQIIDEHYKITELEGKEPNGVLSTDSKRGKLEIAFKDGVPHGKLKISDDQGKIKTELNFADGVINGNYLFNDESTQTKCNLTFKNNVAIAGECLKNNQPEIRIKNSTIESCKNGKCLSKYLSFFNNDHTFFSIKTNENQKSQTVRIENKIFKIEGTMYKRVGNYDDFTGNLSAVLPETLLKTFSLKKGVVDGIVKTYFLFYGSEIGESMYKNDVPHGVSTLDYHNGRVSKTFYENGVINKVEEYNAQELVSEADFQKEIAKKYKDGKIYQIIKRSPKRLSCIDSHRSREIVSSYDKDGKLVRITIGDMFEVNDPTLLKDGELNGIYTHRDNNGRVLKEISFKHNLMDGIYKEYKYDSNGKTTETTITEYKNGRKNGKEVFSFQDIGSKMIRTFWNDLRHGYSIAYNKKGEIKALVLYHLDKPIAKIDQKTIKKFATRQVRLYKDNILRAETELRNGQIDGNIKYYDERGKLIFEVDCSAKKCFIP